MRAFLLTVLLAVLAGFATPALGGERIATDGNNTVRIYETPCLYAAVLRIIQVSERSAFQKAAGTFNGTVFFGCWREVNGMIVLAWEDGDLGMLRLGMFKDPSI